MNNKEAKSKKKSGKKKKTVVIIVVVAVVLLAGVAVAGLKSLSRGMKEAMEQMAVQDDAIYEVKKQDVRQEITTSGTTIGIEKDAYTSPVTARIQNICVEPGQTVKKGDVLLTYDAAELGDNLEKVRLQAKSEQAAGNESYEMADEAAGKVSGAKKKIKELEKDIKKLKEEVESLNDQIVEQEDKLSEAEKDNAKEEAAAATPTEEGTTRAPKLTDTKPIVQKIRSLNKDLAKKQEKLADKQADLAEQEGIVSANKDVKVSESTKAQMDAAKQLSDMSVDEAKESYEEAEAGIVALTDGIVESVEVIEGAYANETQTVMTIIHSDSIGVEFSVAKDDLGYISPEQKARVVVGSNEYDGAVDYISRVAVSDAVMVQNSTAAVIKGRIRIANPDDGIFVGVPAKVYIFVGESKETLAVPYEALNTDVDGDFVLALDEDNRIVRRDVKLGLYSDSYYEVTEGLKEGDKVITKVTADMKPGELYQGSGAVDMSAE